MQTEKLKRFRACAGGCGVSARMAASALSFQTRATLLEAAAWTLALAAQTNNSSRAQLAGGTRRRGRIVESAKT
jgi:hypothetical protein